MKRTNPPETPEELAAVPRDQLPTDLQETLEKVGPQRYGHATARKFAPGGEYSSERRKKQRFALT